MDAVKLLVAALEAELVAFPADLPGFDRLVTGPGKLQATYALTRALDAADYDEIVVVGTAGAIDPRLDGDRLRRRRGDPARRHRHRRHRRPARLAARRASSSAREGVTIATGDHFVDDAEAVAVIRPLGAGLVDMETYAYAWVAAQFGVPIRVLKAVSDRAQDDAITDWRTDGRRVQRAAARAHPRRLRRLARRQDSSSSRRAKSIRSTKKTIDGDDGDDDELADEPQQREQHVRRGTTR